MEKSKVYFTDFRAKLGEGLPLKLKRLLKKAGISEIDMENKFVAIKMHFGELGNVSFLRPNYAKAVADVIKELGGKPFLTDCNTLYPGSRKNALEHLQCAWENGFTAMTVGCPILKGMRRQDLVVRLRTSVWDAVLVLVRKSSIQMVSQRFTKICVEDAAAV